ncbi:MAG TPA: hypothetical protein VK685_08675 [Candidatus Acidoferrum sp.]|nr:hypothetical protein [Candidatus Acidoferrum sp.]
MREILHGFMDAARGDATEVRIRRDGIIYPVKLLGTTARCHSGKI